MERGDEAEWMEQGEGGETPGEGRAGAAPGSDEPGLEEKRDPPVAAEEAEEADLPPPPAPAAGAGAVDEDEEEEEEEHDADVPPPPPPPGGEGEGEGNAPAGEGPAPGEGDGPGGAPAEDGPGAADGPGADAAAADDEKDDDDSVPMPRLMVGRARDGASKMLASGAEAARGAWGALGAAAERMASRPSAAEVERGVRSAMDALLDGVEERHARDEDEARGMAEEDERSASEVSIVLDGLISRLEQEEKQSLNQQRDGDDEPAGEAPDAAAAPAGPAAAVVAPAPAAAANANANATPGAPSGDDAESSASESGESDSEDDDASDASSGSDDEDAQDLHDDEEERELQARQAADVRRRLSQIERRQAGQAARRAETLKRWAALGPHQSRAVAAGWGFENRTRALYQTCAESLGHDRLHDLVGSPQWQGLWALWKAGAEPEQAVAATLDVMDTLEEAAFRARPGFAMPAQIGSAVASLAEGLANVDGGIVDVLDENIAVVAAMEELLTNVQVAVAQEAHERRVVEDTVNGLVGSVAAMGGMLDALESGAFDAPAYAGPSLELDMSLFSPGFEARWEADAARRRSSVDAGAIEHPAAAAAELDVDFDWVAAADGAEQSRRVRFGSDQVRVLRADSAGGEEYDDDAAEPEAGAEGAEGGFDAREAAEPVLPALETSVAESEADSVNSEAERENKRQQRRRQRLSTIETLFSKDALTSQLEAERPPAYALFPDYFKGKMEAEPSVYSTELSSFAESENGSEDASDDAPSDEEASAAGSLHELFERLGIPEEFADNFDQQDIFMSDLSSLSSKALAALLPSREGRRKLEKWMKREEASLDARLRRARKEARKMGEADVPDTLEELFSQLKIPARFLDLWEREQVYMSDLAGLKKAQLRRLLPVKGPRTRLKGYVKSNMSALRAKRAALVAKESKARAEAKVMPEDEYVRWLENEGIKRQIYREQSQKLDEDAHAMDGGEDYLSQYHKTGPAPSRGAVKQAADELLDDLAVRSGKRSIDRLDAAHRLAERGDSSVEELLYLTGGAQPARRGKAARREPNPYVDEFESLTRNPADGNEYTYEGVGLDSTGRREAAAAAGGAADPRGTCQTAAECIIS